LVQVTTNPGSDSSPAWSPDGRKIAHVSVVNPEKMWYATQHLAITTLEPRTTEVLTKELDRNVNRPAVGADDSIYFLLEDSGDQHLARYVPQNGQVERIVSGAREITEFDLGVKGEAVFIASSPLEPEEVFFYEPGSDVRRLTGENLELLKGIALAQVEDIHFESRDGTPIEGYVIKPPDFKEGQRYPTLLWIHGGPVSQFAHAFDDRWQTLAGAGFLVVSANPRGSSGYGEDFSHAIWAAWGQKDYEDVMAAVDHVIELGYSDPDRLGVGGWSYGGILTNYVITQTDRFKAASPGASETNYLACYGTDHYQYEWETELGLPWENRELYLKLSPLTYVEKIVTPTLILCGEHDWNVPLNQSEQLYQALRRLGRDTQLIVYPGQSHSISVPSYQKDRLERYLRWFGEKLGLVVTEAENID
ncbi:MAG: S9 family peptidase, partial [Acidobacteriota bacterium]